LTVAAHPENAGIEVREVSHEEAWAMLDADTRRYLGIGVAEFAERYHAGAYDDPDDDPVVMRLAFDLEHLQRTGAAPE
jgi:hypothetical protein